MPLRDSSSFANVFFEIELDLAIKGSREATRSLYRQLKAAIADGRLLAGAKLPPTRSAQSFFAVSRNTMSEVYERLKSEGYLVTRRGTGTFVAGALPLVLSFDPPTEDDENSESSASRLNGFWLRPDVVSAMGFWHDRRGDPGSGLPPEDSPASVDFRPALVDHRLFPLDVFRRVMTQQLRSLERKDSSDHRSPQGNQGNLQLRESIASHIVVTRAVTCRPEDVLVTSGAQQAFDLLARVLVTPGRTVVAVEDPGYPPMRVAFAAAGARLVPVGVDAEGIRIEEIAPEANVICLCPSHQFPLGVTTSAERRKALVDFARRQRAVIVEDDYDGEFRIDGDPLEALRTSAAADVVFYVGTFSKCMLPTLRLGFVVAPRWAMPTLIAAKNCLDWHCATPIQTAVAAFIAQGHLSRHVRRMRQIYKRRRQHLLDGLRRDFAPWLAPIPSLYGMHVSATSLTATDLEEVTKRLRRDNVHLHALGRYFLGPQTQNGLIFGFGCVDLAEMDRGLLALRNALSGAAASGS